MYKDIFNDPFFHPKLELNDTIINIKRHFFSFLLPIHFYLADYILKLPNILPYINIVNEMKYSLLILWR